MRARQLALCLIVSVGAACAPAASEETEAGGPPSELLYVQADRYVSAVDAATGSLVMSSSELAIPHDWSSVFTASRGATATTISDLDPTEAAKRGAVEVPGDMELTVASDDGEHVALATPRGEGATPWLPDGRAVTGVAVLSPRTGERQDFNLKGNFEPEAFSTDGQELFMIEYIPAIAPDRYRVRRLKLKNGKVAPIGRLKLAAPDQMRGTGRMQVMAPDGSQLYTLYTRQGPNYAHGAPEENREGMVHAFVHLLDLTDRWAHCIDLPMPFGKTSATASAIAMSPSGGPLYVTDWTSGAVAKVSTEKVRVGEVIRLDFGAPDEETFAQAGFVSQRLYVAGNDEVVVLDGDSLAVLDRWSLDGEVTGLLLTADEDRLYVSLGDRIVHLDPMTGGERASFPMARAGGILGLVGREA